MQSFLLLVVWAQSLPPSGRFASTLAHHSEILAVTWSIATTDTLCAIAPSRRRPGQRNSTGMAMVRGDRTATVPLGAGLGVRVRLETGTGTGAVVEPPATGFGFARTGAAVAAIAPLKSSRPCDGSGSTEAGVGPEKTPRPAGPEEKREMVVALANGPRPPEAPDMTDCGRESGIGSRATGKPEKTCPGPREL